MKPHARLLVLDSDWSFLLLHPWTPSETTEVFSAAAPAFKEPLIGRKLKGLMEQAGFVDVVVEVRANVDSTGQLRAVAQNMLDYGLQFNNLTASTAAELRVKIDNAIETGEFLAVLPQFVVTGVKPSPGDLGKLKGGKAKL